jgi:ubiquinone/menaquinone biosynthesis C-methylase UbiE
MKVLDEHTKFAHLGKPGTAFTTGFKRRMNMITKIVNLKDKKILDMGTGEGVWLEVFTEFTSPENVFASEYDNEQVIRLQNSNIKIPKNNIVNCPGEKLDFPDNFFDIVFHNEVLEHVQDDTLVLKECLRVLKPGGKMIFFTPNRGWPFEQHGMFLNGKYYWGNIPLLPWMPIFIYKKFAPHVKNYWWRNLKNKFSIVRSKYAIDNKVIYHSRIFPGFDKMERKFGSLGKLLKDIIHSLEKTPLRFFGISHFVIVEKI